MRLWTIHPRYLDVKGLNAVWREGLLAKKVLEGKTKGYTRHPELSRFRETGRGVEAINQFLFHVWQEGKGRGYRFDGSKLPKRIDFEIKIPVSRETIDFEREHLRKKLLKRAPELAQILPKGSEIELNPIFFVPSR